MLKPEELYQVVASALRAAPVEPEYVEDFLERNVVGMKTAILQSWPILRVPRRSEYLICATCSSGLHRRGDPEPTPHAAIHNIPCPNPRYVPLAWVGDEWSHDQVWNQFTGQLRARWGLCGVCFRIKHLYTVGQYAGQLHSHTRPLTDQDGRKRKDPDCEGTHQLPLAASPEPIERPEKPQLAAPRTTGLTTDQKLWRAGYARGYDEAGTSDEQLYPKETAGRYTPYSIGYITGQKAAKAGLPLDPPVPHL